MYKHVYGDFTKEEKEYQDIICSEAEEVHGDRPWAVLYDYVVDPASLASQAGWRDYDPAASQPGEETSGAFPQLMTAGKHILRPLRILFCVLQRSLPPC